MLCHSVVTCCSQRRPDEAPARGGLAWPRPVGGSHDKIFWIFCYTKAKKLQHPSCSSLDWRDSWSKSCSVLADEISVRKKIELKWKISYIHWYLFIHWRKDEVWEIQLSSVYRDHNITFPQVDWKAVSNFEPLVPALIEICFQTLSNWLEEGQIQQTEETRTPRCLYHLGWLDATFSPTLKSEKNTPAVYLSPSSSTSHQETTHPRPSRVAWDHWMI